MTTWEVRKEGLCKTFEFADFREAFAFMTRVAFVAEAKGHHPDWSNIYNKVSICLNTHDAGGAITNRDHELSQAIDAILK